MIEHTASVRDSTWLILMTLKFSYRKENMSANPFSPS